MASMALTDSGVRTLKRALVEHHPNAKSTHLTEAIARACGFRTHASLLAALSNERRDYVLLDDGAFQSRLAELGGHAAKGEAQGVAFDELPIEYGIDMLRTVSPRFVMIDYSKSSRLRAWRNALVLAINAGLALDLFTLRPGDNIWPDSSESQGGRKAAHIFRFEADGVPAVASLMDAGWDEISVHVALWPTSDAERWVATANAGLLAGDLFASGWLERRNGAWLQVANDSGEGWSFRSRRTKLAQVAAMSPRPAGYADQGSFAL